MNRLILLTLLMISIHIGYAQTPQFSLSGGLSSNTIPLMSATNRVQWVYYRSDFAGLPTGSQLISKIYLRSGTNIGTATYTNLTIRMGHTTLNTFTSGPFVTGLTTVFSATSHTITSIISGGWVEFTLQNPFTYNGTQNIIVEVSQTGYTGGFTVRQNTAGGNRRIFGTATGTSGTAGSGIADFGMDAYPIHACARTVPQTPSFINSTIATVRWGSVTGATNYDYAVSTSPNWPTSGWLNTNNTSATVTGLTPDTRYFLLVRTRCSATTFSFWDTLSFRTLPACIIPKNIKVTRIDSNTADIRWNRLANATRYQYLVDQTRATPLSSEISLATSTLDTFANITGLRENTKYYVHIRSLCPGSDSSVWSLDSFRTIYACKSPALDVQIINKNTVIIHWDTVMTGQKYEYAYSLSSDVPNFGTPIKSSSVQLTTLQPAIQYFLHCRSYCMDDNITTSSPWSDITFSTTTLGVSSVENTRETISVHPNPVKDIMYLNITNATGSYNVVITDLTGRNVKSFELNSNTHSIDLADLQPGHYIIKAINNDKVFSSRFIKE